MIDRWVLRRPFIAKKYKLLSGYNHMQVFNFKDFSCKKRVSMEFSEEEGDHDQKTIKKKIEKGDTEYHVTTSLTCILVKSYIQTIMARPGCLSFH